MKKKQFIFKKNIWLNPKHQKYSDFNIWLIFYNIDEIFYIAYF